MKEFKLSEKKCNIIINKVDLDKYQTIGDLEIRGKETLEWRDGFFKEDIKQFIQLLKAKRNNGDFVHIRDIDKLTGDLK